MQKRRGEARKLQGVPWLFRPELEFWAQVDEVGEHYVWRGAVDRRGRPVSPTVGGVKSQPFPAALEAWWRVERPAPRGELAPTCGEKLCIRPSHQAVLAAS